MAYVGVAAAAAARGTAAVASFSWPSAVSIERKCSVDCLETEI